MDSTEGGTSVGVREKSPIQHDGYEEQPHGCPEFCPPRTTVTPKIFPSKVTCKQSQALLWMKCKAITKSFHAPETNIPQSVWLDEPLA